MDREKTPWLIVLFHVPWYNSNTAHQGEGEDMKASMEHLLYSAGVDVALAGHVHAYERTVRFQLLRLSFTAHHCYHCSTHSLFIAFVIGTGSCL